MGRSKHTAKWLCPNQNCSRRLNHKQSLNNHKKTHRNKPLGTNGPPDKK